MIRKLLRKEISPLWVVGIGLFLSGVVVLRFNTGSIMYGYVLTTFGALLLGHPFIEMWKKALNRDQVEDNNG